MPGAGSQYPDVLIQVLSSSIRTDPGTATFSARLPAGSLATVQLVTTIFHSVGWYAWSLGKAGAIIHQTLSTLLQPSAVKSIRTCQGTPKGQKSAKSGKSKAAATPKPKKATPAKKAAKAPQKTAKAKETAGPREGSKTAQVVAMLQRKNGATLAEIMDKMGWQQHTVRGFMAGAMKKAGYTVESFKSDKGERTYRINQ